MPDILIGTFAPLLLIFWEEKKEDTKEKIRSNGYNINVINRTNIIIIAIFRTYSVLY